MAIRNAIESYSLFVESTTQVTDFQLSTDLVNTISTGQVKAVKILKRLESGRKLCYTIEGLVEPQDLRTAIKEYMTSKSSDLQLQDNGWISILSSLTSEEPSPIIEGKMWKTLTVAIRFLKYTKATQVEEEAVVGSVIGEVIKKLRAAGEKINSKIYVKRFASDYHFKIFVTFFHACPVNC